MSYLNNGNVVTRVYSNFRGADFRGEEINLVRSPDCLNVWKDYKHTESIRTRPGMEQIVYGDGVFGLFFFEDEMILHAGNSLIIVYKGHTEPLYDGVISNRSNSFVYEGVWYFKDGKNYLQYGRFDGSQDKTIRAVEGYIPTTTIARNPMGGGTKYEDVNMLSDYRKNSFLSDGTSKIYVLDAKDIDSDYYPEITINDEVVAKDEYTIDFKEGTITFDHFIPASTLTDGQDNVVIKFKKAVPKHREAILNCDLIQVFDNRVFFSGNPEYPNVIWHSSLNDPSYVSDLDYYNEGMDRSAVKGMVAGNNALWVFREPSDSNTTIFYHTPSLDGEYGKVYPSVHSSVNIGCVGKAINFNDDIVFFSERGMEGISGDITTEQVVSHRSSLVDSKMLSEAKYKDMVLVEWQGYLLVCIGNKVYLADSRAMFQNENHYEYEWWYWELKKEIISAVVNDGILYLGTEDGVYTLTDNDNRFENVESYFVTALDKFKHPNKLKTTNKRGCVVEATTGIAPDCYGEISVYAKLEDTDFELIGKYENVKDYFVSRIKRKKFKDIQLKFYSNTRFSLETVTLECFIGGYIKR